MPSEMEIRPHAGDTGEDDSVETGGSPRSTARTPRQTRREAPSGSAVRTPWNTLRRVLGVLGPGLITGAADDDPSGIGTYAQAGATFGFAQLWLALYMLPLMIAVQEMCGRIGIVTRKGVADILREHYARPVLYVAVALVIIANTINIGADLGGMAASVLLIVPGIPFMLVLAVIVLFILALEIFVPYRYYTSVLKVLVLFLLAYVATGIIIHPDWGEIARATLVPHIQLSSGFVLLVVGLLGTTISPYLFFWQASEEVEEMRQLEREPVPDHRRTARHERGRQRRGRVMFNQLRHLRVDTLVGMVGSETIAWFIMITTGGTLYTHHMRNISSAEQAAAALRPLVHAGGLARLIFALGIVGAGMLAIPTLAGSAAYVAAATFGWRASLSLRLRRAPGFYGVIVVAMLVGLGLNLIGVNPIHALVYSAVINGIVAVPLLVLLLLIANNARIMRGHTNSLLSNAVNIIATLAMGVASVITIISLFHS